MTRTRRPSEGRAGLRQELEFFGVRRATEQGVAVRKATKSPHDVAMAHGEVERILDTRAELPFELGAPDRKQAHAPPLRWLVLYTTHGQAVGRTVIAVIRH